MSAIAATASALPAARALFVPYTLGGETVEVEPVDGHPDRRLLTRIEQRKPGTHRAFLPIFQRLRRLRNPALAAGSVSGVETRTSWSIRSNRPALPARSTNLVDAHGAGRRRITVHARRGNDGELHTGFAAAGSHAIVAITDCPILDPGLHGALDAARALAETLKPAGKPLDIQVTAASNGLDVDVRGSGPLTPALIATLSALAQRHGLARLTRHGELVLMRAPPTIGIGVARVTLPPGSFLQATIAGEEALAALVTAHCKHARHVADLFCGVGPFALRLASKARVSAWDSDAGAIAALQKASTSASGLKPVKAESRDLFRRPLMPQELRDYDTVVFDPPRQGAQAQVRQLAASKVPVVIAVSCNAATFARDARMLIDGGYKIEGVTPVDQFRHTPHVELIARFSR